MWKVSQTSSWRRRRRPPDHLGAAAHQGAAGGDKGGVILTVEIAILAPVRTRVAARQRRPRLLGPRAHQVEAQPAALLTRTPSSKDSVTLSAVRQVVTVPLTASIAKVAVAPREGSSA